MSIESGLATLNICYVEEDRFFEDENDGRNQGVFRTVRERTRSVNLRRGSEKREKSLVDDFYR